MAKQRRTDEPAGSTAVLEPPAGAGEYQHADDLPPVPQRPALPRAGGTGDYRFKLNANWLAPFITITGAESEEAARKELHRFLDLAIKDVQRA